MFLNKFITRNSHIGGIPVASITAFIFTFIIFYAIMRFLSNYEEKEINKKIMNNENNKNKDSRKKKLNKKKRRRKTTQNKIVRIIRKNKNT